MNCERCLTHKYLREDELNGYTVCTNCGLVLNEHMISDEATWDKSNECMSHSFCDEFSLPTQKVKGKSYLSFFTTQDPHTLKLMAFNKKFNRMFEYLEINESLREEARNKYLECERKMTFKGRNMEYVIGAFIYIAAKKTNFPIDVKTLGDEIEVMKCVKFIEQGGDQVNIEKPKEVYEDKDIVAYIRKYGGCVGLNRKVVQDIIKLIPKAQYLMRKKEVIAASLIIYHLNDKCLLSKLVKTSGISPNAIKSTLQELSNTEST